jgi:hypothetical protein
MALFLNSTAIVWFPNHSVEDLLEIAGITGNANAYARKPLVLFVQLRDPERKRLQGLIERRKKRSQSVPVIRDIANFPTICLAGLADFGPGTDGKKTYIPFAHDVREEFRKDFVKLEDPPRPTIELAEAAACSYVESLTERLRVDPIDDVLEF